MKNLIFKSSFLEKLTRLLALMLILVASVNQAKADTNISFSGGYIYFADEYDVHQGSTQLCGRKSNCSGGDWYTAVTTLSNIGHTKLYYTSSLEGSGWSNVCWAGWALISNSSGKSNSGTEYWSGSNSTWYSNFNSYGFNSGSTYLITVASASKGASATTSYKSSGYSALNNNQTVYKYTSSGGTSAASYTAQSVNSGTVTISAYKMTGNGTASNSSNSGTINTANATSTTKPAAFTGEVTLTASANSGYTFMGWFESTSATTAVSTETTYTYNAPNSTKSIYARFKAEATHSVTHTEYCTSTSTQLSTETVSVGEVTYSEFSAPVKAGYTFANWTYGNGISLKAGDSNTSNPIHVKTLSTGTYTLQANYTEDLSSPWHLLGASTPFGGWASSNSNMLQKASGSSTGSVASITINVSALPSAEEYTFKLYNATTGKWRTNGGYWVTRENNNPTLSTEGGNDNELIFKPDIAGNYVFTLDYSESNPVLTVTFPTRYTVTYSVSPSGAANAITTSPSVTSGGYVVAGTSVTFTHAAAKTGYQWYRWENGSGSNLGNGDTYSATINANTTVKAVYQENKFNVSASASPAAGGTVTPTSATSMGQVTGGDITASPNAGYSFGGWSIASGTGYFGTSGTATTSNTANTKFRPTAAATLTGSFSEVMRTVTVDVNNSYLGSVSTTSLTSVGPATASAEVTATPVDGATFSSWTLPSGISAASTYTSSSNPIKVNATAADKTITANFTETTYTVSMSTADASKGTVGASSASVGQITAVEITATPKSGYMFSAWVKVGGSGTVTYYTGPGNGQLTDASGEEKETTYICVNGDVTLQATWEPDRSSGYVVFYGNDGKDADGNSDPSQARAWKDGKLYRASTAESDESYFTFTAGVGDVGKVIEFKVHKLSPSTWYGYNSASGGKIDSDISNVVLNTSYGNGRMCVIMPGSYLFTWNKSNNKLSIRYPNDVYYLRGGFNGWLWTLPMTETSTGVYSATVNMTEANHTYSGDDGFKVLIAGKYYGKNSTTVTRSTSTGSSAISSCSTSGANIGITTDYTGNYTFTYTVSTNTLQVTYPTAYKVTFSKGSVNGTSGTISAKDIDNGDAAVSSNTTWVLNGHRVTLTAPAAKDNYSWKGWYTNAAGTEGKISDTNRAITVTMNSNKTLYACYTENMHTVSVSAGAGGAVSSSSLTNVGVATASAEVTATPNVGYVFTGWTLPASGVTAAAGYTTSSNPIKVNATADSKSITANFAAATAFIEGRFHITNASRNGTWTNTFGSGQDWNENSATIKFTWDGTNSRYYLHTYATPHELTTQIGGHNPSFYIKESSSSSSLANVQSYWSATTQTLTAAGTGNKKTLAHTGELVNNNLRFNSSDESGYTIIYFDEVGIWYELEQTLKYDGNGNTGGSAPAGTVYYNKGTNATAASNTYTKTGYHFTGWNTKANGTGTSYAAGATNVAMSSNITLYAQWTPNNYTVTFDKNGGLSEPSPATKSVTYNAAYGTLPAGPTPPQADQFAGWFTTATGVGELVTAETIVETASDHTLYARYEHTYTVTVQYKCGTDVLRAQTTTHASLTSVAAEISAPELLGYEFVNWTGDNATFADANSANTTVNVSAATTIVANYRSVPMVYFKNNLDWDNVYVTFEATFNSSKQNAPSNNGKPYYQMTQLGKSDIFYCVIPSTYTDNNYAGWQGTIAFDNQNYNGKATDDAHTGNMEAFYGGQFLGRGDFDPNATMFIPYSGDTEIRNSGTYYPTGCWLRYNSTNSSYTVRANTAVSGDGTALDAVALTADVAGATEFTAKVWLNDAEHVYGVMLRKEYLKNSNDLLYTNVNNEANTITSATTSLPWSWQPCASNWQRCRVKAEAVGWYTFTVSFATGRPMVNIEYPLTVGDFRLVYKDAATWNKTHGATWKQISPVFKHKADRVDTASFFVSYGSSPALELQKCTAISGGEETWTKQSDVILSSISSKGVYNFTVTQNNAGTAATAAYLGAYTGKYYVRTDASDGGWNDYKSTSNQMTYSEYSMSHGGSSGPYSYYYMRHVTNGQNIKFVVANDYSFCLSDTMINDTYASEWIEREANVRFTYNHTNNLINRAYISGSSNVADRFLVLEGDEHLYDADGHPLTGTYKISGLNDHEMKFIDDQNWVYETTVRANPLERVKLTAKFNDEIQYFYGAEGERTTETTYQLIGGTTSATKYKIRVVYDFKTNRLVSAWLPTNDPVAGTFNIDADVMIIRYHQADAQQVTFSSGGKLTDVKTVYGAMQFNKYRLNNQDESDQHDLGLSPYERDLFFISFPFDVKLNDVFGFGTYGKHWIIEYYDGKTRAQNGYWKDSPTNWKFVTKAMRDGYTLKANEGYVLALDLDELKFDSPVWDYGVENVYLYFPSKALVKNIQATSATVEIDTVGYQCKINRGTIQGDRRVKDSHWHLIGVPSYANAYHLTSSSWSTSTGDLEQTIYYPNIDPADWTLAAPFVYDWNAHDNKFGVVSTTSYSFKPMHSYLVQYARDTLEWRQVNATVASAPRRAMFAYEPCDFRLELMQDENVIDQAFISMRDDEEVTADFDFNYDLSKMLYGAFTSKSNIYTFAGNEEVAANCLPFKDETTVVPVGVTVNEGEEGEYIFSIPEGTSGVGVTLIDNERQIRTNLALTDYMTYLTAGEYTERFVLEISPIEQTTTGVEQSAISSQQSAIQKRLIDGVLYIVKDGKVFDARGARIQ